MKPTRPSGCREDKKPSVRLAHLAVAFAMSLLCMAETGKAQSGPPPDLPPDIRLFESSLSTTLSVDAEDAWYFEAEIDASGHLISAGEGGPPMITLTHIGPLIKDTPVSVTSPLRPLMPETDNVAIGGMAHNLHDTYSSDAFIYGLSPTAADEDITSGMAFEDAFGVPYDNMIETVKRLASFDDVSSPDCLEVQEQMRQYIEHNLSKFVLLSNLTTTNHESNHEIISNMRSAPQRVGTSNLTFAVTVIPTPEPSTLVLLGIGAIGLLTRAWRKRNVKRVVSIVAVFCVVCLGGVGLAEASVDSFGSGDNQFNIEFVPISGATNPTDTSPSGGFGIVNNNYRMGKFEITNDQWDKFKAAYGTVTGSPPGAYDQNRYYTGANLPTETVSWYEAAQFVNWLNTSTNHQAAYKFNGTPGNANYTFEAWAPSDSGYNANNPYRNSNAYYFLPTENEWVKAAYWNGTALQTYATIGDVFPTQGNGSGTNWSGWNYCVKDGSNDVYVPYPATLPAGPWDVGIGSQELNGTYDMMGDVWEWMESPYSNTSYDAGSLRAIRGGGWWGGNGPAIVASSYLNNAAPVAEYRDLGFRVASLAEPNVVPEPSTILIWSLLGSLAIGIGWWRKRNVKRVSAIVGVLCVVCLGGAGLADASVDSFGSGDNQFNIEFVSISGATNPTSGVYAGDGQFIFTGVNHDYRIGKFEITNDQWNKFKAAYGTVTGNEGYAYDSYYTGTNVPTNMVSWFEAAQFVNWLNTSTGHQAAYKFTGTIHTSNYEFATWSDAEAATNADGTKNLYRNKNAFYFLPTSDEWVKAAYWNGTELQAFATKDGGDPVQGNGTNGTGWNYITTGYATDPPGPWAVGSGSEELNGTYDMMGNVAEWIESSSNLSYDVYAWRCFRGGAFGTLIQNGLSSGYNNHVRSMFEWDDFGFRVASAAVPEPSTFVIFLGIGAISLLAYVWRRRRAV